MIILISLAMICFAAYAVFVIDFMVDKFHGRSLGFFASMFAIIMPPSIIVQILVYMEVIKIV